MSPNSIEIFIEELLLMIFTVFMAIWSLTSKGYATKFKLLDEQNSLPWGLAFGYAYAGSVAMLTNVFDEITTVMTIGHSVVVITVIYVYRKVLLNVFSKHDDGVLMRRLAANIEVKTEETEYDESDIEETVTEIEIDVDDSEDEDWQEDSDVDWDKENDDKTISTDVEWEDTIELD